MTEHRTPSRPASDPRADDGPNIDVRSGDVRTGDVRTKDLRTDDVRAAEHGRTTEPATTADRVRAAEQTRTAEHGRQPAQQQPGAQQQTAGQAAPAPLLGGPDLEAVTRRWHDIQAGFVDAPQQAVKDADALVADLMNRLAQMFATERTQLESHWSRGDQVSTEELRVSLQRYRSFFQRLLSVH